MYHVADQVVPAVDFLFQQKEREIHMCVKKVISYSGMKKIQHRDEIRNNGRYGLL